MSSNIDHLLPPDPDREQVPAGHWPGEPITGPLTRGDRLLVVDDRAGAGSDIGYVWTYVGPIGDGQHRVEMTYLHARPPRPEVRQFWRHWEADEGTIRRRFLRLPAAPADLISYCPTCRT